MSIFSLLRFQPRFAPEGDTGSAGGSGEGSGEPAGSDAGGGAGGEGGSTAPSLADVLEELRATRKDFDQFKHRSNKELERLRRGRGEGGGSDDREEGKQNQPEHVTRDELRAERQYSRGLGKLEALGLDADALAEVEEVCDDLPPAERARYVEAYALGLERGGKGDKPDNNPEARDRDGRRRQPPRGKGGEPPPNPRGSDVPETWDEYVALKKKDPERAKKLLNSGEVNLVELREKRNIAARA